MAYVEPATVWAPKASIRSVEILYNSGPGGWSVASIDWEARRRSESGGTAMKDRVLEIRSRAGTQLWFILPDELREVITEQD